MNNIESRIRELTAEYTRRWAVRGQHARDLENDDRELAKIETVLGELSKLIQPPPTGDPGKDGAE